MAILTLKNPVFFKKQITRERNISFSCAKRKSKMNKQKPVVRSGETEDVYIHKEYKEFNLSSLCCMSQTLVLVNSVESSEN